MNVSDLMTREPACCRPDDACARAAMLMREEDCGSIPVVEDGRLVGIVTDRDITVRCVAAGHDPKTTRVSEVMSADPICVAPDTSADEAEKVMADRQVRRLPVVDAGRLVGIVVTAQLARTAKPTEVGKTIKGISGPASGRASHARG